ncbi:MAG: hypothetical protein FWE98_01585 [Oscillospiraceae bacterium]|nr:hypothetical protein [Oscillospiraceae bacterium]
MKKIISLAFVLVLLVLCGCVNTPEQTYAPEVFAWDKPAEDYEMSFNYDSFMWPGQFTIYELMEHFGRPERLWADATDALSLGIGVNFDGIGFSLSGTTEQPGREYCLPDSLSDDDGLIPSVTGMALRLPLRITTVTGAQHWLPRDIRIGDSLETVLDAHPRMPHAGEVYGNRDARLYYRHQKRWGVQYGVTYFFTEGILTEARIEWPQEAEPLETEERVPPTWYPYTEFDESLQPGYYSINELAKHFGEPIYLIGSCVANMGPGYNIYGLLAVYEGITLEMWDDGGDVMLSYNMNDYDHRPLVPIESDKALRLELAGLTVTGKNISLPRGIHVGDSLEKVLDAYPGETYRETDDGKLVLDCNYYNKWDEKWIKKHASYLPEWTYGIRYYFADGKLSGARLDWFNSWAHFD